MTTKDLLIWDMILPLAPEVGNDFGLLERFRAAGHRYVSLTIAGDDCGLAEAMHRLAGARRKVLQRGDDWLLALNAEDVLRAHRENKLAVGLHLEGTECLERDVDALDLMHALGIRHAILAFNRNNSAAGGCADLGNVGLSRLGRRYVERMGALGLLLDLSHTAERAALEAMELIGMPVVFTHSNAQALHPHYRNVSDATAKACAATGGLIGISGSTLYLGPAPTLAEGVFRHIDHFVQTIGPEHVGLGTDYVADAQAVMDIFAQRPDEWPREEGAEAATIAYMPPEDLVQVIGHMQRAGYDAATVAGIVGGNYLRIASRVWTA